jgi:hypothetical protein
LSAVGFATEKLLEVIEELQNKHSTNYDIKLFDEENKRLGNN